MNHHDGPRLPESRVLFYLSVYRSIYLAKFGMDPGIPGVEGPHGGAPTGRLPLLFEVEILEKPCFKFKVLTYEPMILRCKLENLTFPVGSRLGGHPGSRLREPRAVMAW